MSGIKCKIIKENNKYVIYPLENNQIKKYGKYNLKRQICKKTTINKLIDIRRIALNKCINSQRYIYLFPMSNHITPYQGAISGISLIQEYSINKKKNNKLKVLNYRCDYSCTNIF